MGKNNPIKVEVKVLDVESLSGTSLNPYAQDRQVSDPVESFEEWKLRVSELDNAVRKHLRPTKSDNWRLIDVPRMLGQWRTERRFDKYLNLVERWLYTLMAFEAGGSLTTKIVIQHLLACEAFLNGPVCSTSAERKLAIEVSSLRDKLDRILAKKANRAA